MSAALEIVAFGDRREHGRFPVLGVDGATLARIKVPWGGRRFVASTPDEAVLCTGRGRAFTRNYEVYDATGALRLSIRSEMWSTKRRTVTFCNGAELYLQGASWPDRGWVLIDSARTTSLSIAATAGTWSLHPDAYAVRIEDPHLALIDIVGIVQANRILVKAERGAAAAAAS